jgi:aldehyde:ferredoxin oxidoreductase
VLAMNKIGVLPTRNFSETVFGHADNVSGEFLLTTIASSR